jgi:hypothetical protein
MKSAPFLAAYRPIPAPARRTEKFHYTAVVERAITCGDISSCSGITALASLLRHTR